MVLGCFGEGHYSDEGGRRTQTTLREKTKRFSIHVCPVKSLPALCLCMFTKLSIAIVSQVEQRQVNLVQP